MDSLDKALFFGIDSQSEEWTKELVQRGSFIMSRLLDIFQRESCEARADYFEKIFVKMNKESVDLVQRLTWEISSAYHKRALQLLDNKN